MITLNIRSFITHKKSETLSECQDARSENVELGCFAISDGATRSFFPKVWAELLVRHFCESPIFSLEEANWQQWLIPIQKEWYELVSERVKIKNKFYLTNSLNTREPAVSTFIGLQVDITEQQWQALIIGDSCMFHKNGSTFKSYLIEKSEDFSNHPEIFASFPERNNFNPTFLSGGIQSGDLFVLATDALAKWILEHKEAGNVEEIIDQLTSIKDNDHFNRFVNRARTDEDIRLVNDDVTLMLIFVEEVHWFYRFLRDLILTLIGKN